MDTVSNEVAIVIPIYKSELTSYEEIALTQCCRVLAKHPIFFVTFEELDLTQYHSVLEKENKGIAGIKYYDANYFSSIKGYNELMLSREFYYSFTFYKYILIYQLDCFVFKDELKEWCASNLDYIGAPWFKDFTIATQDAPYFGVGNGGFSLRKVAAFLNVLESDKKIIHLTDFNQIRSLYAQNKVKGVIKFLQVYLIGNNTHYKKNQFSLNEDYFWGILVQNLFLEFKAASVQEALKFGFEVHPARMFKDNNNNLPFGCHAWWRYDLNFWKPYIEGCGYVISTP